MLPADVRRSRHRDAGLQRIARWTKVSAVAGIAGTGVFAVAAARATPVTHQQTAGVAVSTGTPTDGVSPTPTAPGTVPTTVAPVAPAPPITPAPGQAPATAAPTTVAPTTTTLPPPPPPPPTTQPPVVRTGAS